MNFRFCGAKILILLQTLAKSNLKNTLIYINARVFSNLLHFARKTPIFRNNYLTAAPPERCHDHIIPHFIGATSTLHIITQAPLIKANHLAH